MHTDYVESIAMKMLGQAATSAKISDIRKLVERRSIIPIGRDFNDHDGLINLQNGMLNLETEELSPHDKEHFSTIQLGVKFDVNASCHPWEKFLDEIFEGDLERIDLVQEFMGYSLVPDTSHEKALLLIGEGANGKSTLLRVWEQIAGTENISSVTLANLQNQFHRVTLHRMLLNIAAEVNARALEQSDYFKRIVSGDTIDAAHKNKPVFHFRPHARLIFAMNRMPSVKDTSYGFYRRLLMVPFNMIFAGEQADRQLAEKLLVELDGIFLWALEGLQRLYRNDSFTVPRASEKLLRDYMRANNPIISFVEEICELDSESATLKNTLYEEYAKYCQRYRYPAVSFSTFFRELYSAYSELRPARLGPRDGTREHYVKGIDVSSVL